MTPKEIDSMTAGGDMDRAVYGALGQGRNQGLADGESCPQYSMSLSAAMDALYSFSPFEISRDEKGFHVQVRNDRLEWHDADAETLPLAICRAVLKAL